jgi:signal peptidase I
LTAPPEKKHARRPWRDNIEALVMAIVMAVMLKYFIVEAYQIPTGSMQPTLMGNDEAGIKDRIIVDKLSFHFRDPERFEVVVFRYPLDRSKSFIKRICGMPGEELRIALGDLWTRKGPDEEWKVVRRPLPVQGEVWKRLYPKDPRYSSWRIESGAKSWAIQGRDRIQARGEGTVRLPNDGGSVIDGYCDGYPGEMGDALARARRFPAGHPVETSASRATSVPSQCKRVVAVLREGSRRCLFEIPGPAAPDGEIPRIRTETPGRRTTSPEGEGPRPRGARKRPSASGRQESLLLGPEHGRPPRARDRRRARRRARDSLGGRPGRLLRARGRRRGRRLHLTRALSGHLLPGGQPEVGFEIPEGSYVMLGDNTQDSSDSRFWTLTTMGPDGAGPRFRGNFFPRRIR